MHELELNDATAVGNLIEICTKEIMDQESRSNIIDVIIKAKNTQKMDVSLDTLNVERKQETIPIPLAKLPKLLAKPVTGDGETSSRGAGRVRAKLLETPRIIVSAAKTLQKRQ